MAEFLGQDFPQGSRRLGGDKGAEAGEGGGADAGNPGEIVHRGEGAGVDDALGEGGPDAEEGAELGFARGIEIDGVCGGGNVVLGGLGDGGEFGAFGAFGGAEGGEALGVGFGPDTPAGESGGEFEVGELGAEFGLGRILPIGPADAKGATEAVAHEECAEVVAIGRDDEGVVAGFARATEPERSGGVGGEGLGEPRLDLFGREAPEAEGGGGVGEAEVASLLAGTAGHGGVAGVSFGGIDEVEAEMAGVFTVGDLKAVGVVKVFGDEAQVGEFLPCLGEERRREDEETGDGGETGRKSFGSSHGPEILNRRRAKAKAGKGATELSSDLRMCAG